MYLVPKIKEYLSGVHLGIQHFPKVVDCRLAITIVGHLFCDFLFEDLLLSIKDQ